ncbi:MAG: hypothetical protein ACPGRZ_03210 [Alphaproteobacteria bacterium]
MRLLTFLIVLLTAVPAAADLNPPKDAVVLTITGNIAQTNRGPFVKKRESFIGYHERSFTRAAEFDRAMLDDLGTHRAYIEYDGWAEPVRFEGPRLTDVLKAVGWTGMKITTLALDGFGTAIEKRDIEAHNWILATRGNGKPFGIGQRGPLWLVFDPPGDRPASEQEEGKWPWAIFLIHAE